MLAEARSCSGRVTVDVAAVAATCDEEGAHCETGGCGECVGTPVHTVTGDMSYNETQPIAGLDWIPFKLSYNSNTRMATGLFGKGWHSILSSKFTEYTGIDGAHYVGIYTERGTQYLFSGDGENYTQIYPKMGSRSSLSRSQDAFIHTDPDGRVTRRFVAGNLAVYTDRSTDRSLFVTWSDGLPTRLVDSWGSSATITTNATTGLITAITPDSDPSLAWTYTYNGTFLTASSSPEGVWRRYEYWTSYFGTPQQLTTVRDGAGRIVERHVYKDWAAKTSEQQNDDVTAITNGLAGRVAEEVLSTITYRTGRTTKHYRRFIAGKWRVVEIVDGCASCGSNNRLVSFDSAGNVARTQEANGYVTSRTYDDEHRITNERRSLQPLGCDPAVDANRCWQTPESLGLVELVDTPVSVETSYAYGDPNWPNRPTLVTTQSVRQPNEQRTESFTYHPTSGQILERVITGWTGTPARQETRTTTTGTYDGVEGAVFAPGGDFDGAWLLLPQPAGRPKTIDGPRTDVADVTTFVYYPIAEAVPQPQRGRLAAVRNALGHVTRYEDYDAFGNARRTIDANGVVTLSTFDRLGRRTATILPALSTCDTVADPLCATPIASSITYDGAGPIVTKTSPSGAVATFTYDDRGRVAIVARGPATNDLRERTRFTYDSATGKKSRETVELLKNGTWVETRHTDYAYDASSQLSSSIAADGSRADYTYDVDGQLASAQDENHNAPNTFYNYDPSGRLAGVRQILSSSSEGEIDTLYSYDHHGNLNSVTDPNGNRTTYQYDDFGRMLSQTSPVTGMTEYSYDKAGNLLTTADANGASTHRSYDALGRVVSQTSSRGSDSEAITWTFDQEPLGVGRLAAATDPTGTTTYRYDRRGLLLHEEKTIDGVSYSTSYTYDSNGQQSTLTYPSGMTVEYSYDFAARPVSASVNGSPLVTNARYLPFGPPEEIVFGNGTRRLTTYDTRNRILSHRLTRGGTEIVAYGYEQDPAGNITSIRDLLDARYDRAFAYDDLNRLVGTDTGTKLWGTGTYQYDGMGNLLSSTIGSDHRSFSYLGPKPQRDTVTEFGVAKNITYDPAGNELSVADETYSYNPRNQLAQVRDTVYGYDARGTRAVTSTNGIAYGLVLSLSPAVTVGGEPTTIRVQADSVAPAGGLRVELSSSDRSVILTPGSLLIPEGQSSASMTMITLPQYEDNSVTIVGTHLGNSTTATATVLASPKIASFTIAASPIVGGTTVEGTILLNSPAVAPGEVVQLSSSSSSVAPPPSVTIPGGATSLTFDIATSPVTTDEEVSIRAALRGTVEQLVLVVGPPEVSDISITPTDVAANQSAVGQVTLSHIAPAGGVVVTLQSSVPEVTIPATILVPAGSRTKNFEITAGSAGTTTTATITAVHGSSASATLTIWAETFLADLAIEPASIVGGRMTASGTATLSLPAPPGGSVITLTKSDPVVTIPENLLIEEGNTVGTFAVTSAAVSASTIVDVTGVYGSTRSAEIKVGSCSSWVADRIAPSEPETVWFDDALPVGAVKSGIWTADTRQYISGEQSHTEPPAAGLHQHSFTAGAPMTVTDAGDELFVYVLLDPCNPPRELMLQWNDGNWEHRAYWGENLIGWGASNTNARRYMGALPEPGRWTRLAVPAGQVGLARRNVTGMAFALYDGRVWFDRSGILACESAVVEPVVPSADEAVWFDDDLPSAASPTNWQWDTAVAASGSRSHTSPVAAGLHQNSFVGATSAPLSLTADSSVFTYVLLDACNPPRELMLQWNDGSWEHRAYWGENLIGYGSNGTKSRRHMGPLPAAGRWTRLAVPASNLGLASRNVTGAAFTLYDGKAWFDRIGSLPCRTTPAVPSLPVNDVGWFDDAPPAGATLIGTWLWETEQKASGSQSFHRARSDSPHSFGYTTTAPVTLFSGDTIVVWVELDPCDPPQEMMVEFYDGSGWEHRAVWGTANILQGGVANTASQRRMGAMPAAGEWVRLEIPAALIEVTNVYGMRFQLSDGHAWWDRPGQAPAQQAQAAPDVRSPETEAEAETDFHRIGWWSRLLPRRKAEAPPVSMSIDASYVSHSSTERRYSIYSPGLQLIAETAKTSTTQPLIAHEYIWFGGEPLAQIDTTTGEIAYYFNDHLGAPIVQTDDAGSVVWRAEREPYGERFATRVGLDRHQPLGLPGQEYDESAPDRQYNVFRWYRAGWGRYTQADPKGLDEGPNLYSYVYGNPIRLIDPYGLAACSACSDCPSGEWEIESDDLFGGPGLSFGGVVGIGRTTTYVTYTCKDFTRGARKQVPVVIECGLIGPMLGGSFGLTGPLGNLPNACGCNESDLFGTAGGWTAGLLIFGIDIGDCSTKAGGQTFGGGFGKSWGGGFAYTRCTTRPR